MCSKHYMRVRRHGDAERVDAIFGPIEDQFWAKVTRGGPDECWPWRAATSNGYGQLRSGGKLYWAHRVAYELQVGPIPKGLTIDHTCVNPICQNARHMEPVTGAENTRRVHQRSSSRGA